VADGLDSRQAAVRQTIEAQAEQARGEADAATRRLSEWHAHNRRKGLWKRIRPFGYLVNDGRLAPHPTEAPIVRGMVDSFLAGSSLRGIAKGLNAQGVKPPRLVFYEEAIAKGYRAKRPSATPWSYVAVRGILTAPALAALISHGGEPCRDEHGLPIFAGVGIVDLDERSQILEERRRRAMSAVRLEQLGEMPDETPNRSISSPGLVAAGMRQGAPAHRDASRRHLLPMCQQGPRADVSWSPHLGPGPRVRGGAVGSRPDPLGPTASGGSRWALTSAWEDLSLARRRALLADAIQEVWVFGADVPLDRRVHIVWIGEDPPAPRRRR